MSKSEERLLTDLCSICHQVPKYRCPGCFARTCSLPCTKRHKERSGCTGIRNPGAYLKRSQLATPSSIDRDYNFLSGIERKLESAGRDAVYRGISIGPTSQSPHKGGPVRGEVNLEKAVQECGVIIDRAPKGMKRSLENNTSWSRKQKCISWTVEWLFPSDTDTRRELATVLEKQNVLDALEQRIRHGQYVLGTITNSGIENNEGPNPYLIFTKVDTFINAEKAAGRRVHPPHKSLRGFMTLKKIAATEVSTEVVEWEPAPLPSLQFYLHHLDHNTRGTSARLLPISKSTTLAQVLKGRIVREFPTIYVFGEEPLHLPTEFTIVQEILTESSAAPPIEESPSLGEKRKRDLE